MLAVLAVVVLVIAAIAAFVALQVQQQRRAVEVILAFRECALCGSDQLEPREGDRYRCMRCGWDSLRETSPHIAPLVLRHRLLREAELEITAATNAVQAAVRAQERGGVMDERARGRMLQRVEQRRPLRSLLFEEAREHLARARAHLRALDPSHEQLVPANITDDRSSIDVHEELRTSLYRIQTLRADLGRRIREGSYRTN